MSEETIKLATVAPVSAPLYNGPLPPIPDNEKTQMYKLDYVTLDDLKNDTVFASMDEVLTNVAEEMTEGLNKSIAALVSATEDFDFGYVSEGYKDTERPPQQTALFNIRQQPREYWAYKVQYRVRLSVNLWSDWSYVPVGKILYRSKVLALRRIDHALKKTPIYADPRNYQWAAQPYYLGMTWRDHVKSRLLARKRKQALAAKSRAMAVALQAAAMYEEARNKGAWVEDLPNDKVVVEFINQYEVNHPGGWATGKDDGWEAYKAPLKSCAFVDFPVAANTVSGSAMDLKKAANAALATQVPLSAKMMKDALYLLQKEADAKAEAMMYAVQPTFVVHPKWLEQVQELGTP